MKLWRIFYIYLVHGLFAKFVRANEMQGDEPLNCPAGYVLFDGLCYLSSVPPPFDCNSATTESVEIPATVKPEPEPPQDITQCPAGSTFLNGQCRKIICPMGELIGGRCLRITCPAGMVWRDHSCQEPEYLTTILEIENVFRSEVHENPGNITRIDRNKIENISTSTHIPIIMTSTTTTTLTPPTTTTTKQVPPAQIMHPDCCTVHSPRLCKNYQKKWVCFNHRRRFCDRRICAFPTMYLRTPQIVYKQDLLVMPPHPPLKACEERGCDASSTLDCSGCTRGEKENCSLNCYYYYCPEDTCGFMDLSDFCQLYPKHPFGCNQNDCIWGWCGGENVL